MTSVPRTAPYIKSVKLTNGKGKEFDLTALTAQFVIYEDMFANTHSGLVTLVDTQNILQRIDIHGNETIDFEFGSLQDTDKLYKGSYRVYKVSDKREEDSFTTSLDVCFFSAARFDSMKKTVSKKYDGKISKIAEDVFNDTIESTDKSIKVEASKTQTKLVVPNMSPFDTMNWLSSRAENSDGSSNYFFYEDFDSFHFRSLDDIISSGKSTKDIYYHIGMYGKRNDEVEDSLVIEYAIDKYLNRIPQVTRGMLASKLFAVDGVRKKWNICKFSYPKKFDEFEHTESGKLTSKELDDEFGEEYNSKVITMPSDEYVYDNKNEDKTVYDNIQEKYQKRISYMEQVGSGIRTRITIPGDVDLHAPTIISLKLPSKGTDGKEDEYLSADYLVTKVAHVFGGPQQGGYYCGLELASTSVKKDIGTAGEGSDSKSPSSGSEPADGGGSQGSSPSGAQNNGGGSPSSSPNSSYDNPGGSNNKKFGGFNNQPGYDRFQIPTKNPVLPKRKQKDSGVIRLLDQQLEPTNIPDDAIIIGEETTVGVNRASEENLNNSNLAEQIRRDSLRCK